MTHHKIVALKLTQNGDTFTLNGLTESPRGTKVMVSKVDFKPTDKTQKGRRDALELAVKDILGQNA